MKLYCINATSKLGRRVQSGPWSARWIWRKALAYQNGGFSEVVIVDLGAKQEFSLSRFRATHPVDSEIGEEWQLDR